ncbi:FMN-dependent NADH-azoreductase-Azo-dye reductase-FMN-dependent NADH-azo compound oxidoreductase [Moritella viscosa]|uniref:FMN-dependent NADH-azoreductase n=1 Tax=Moritella viscosa TaxID=80854 RepID=UPI000508F82A|nr:NAD(P)H-dependent oxidoreductase [Moritella viscosa]CED59202.1 FMN-dependent NADH-azoreductase [Moritella viscosa]SGY86461.1 FMN-dependent NADH-azoreductase-Azo-dye reductase-FMN-dependent NADH-azo compound oxidoreductase [Moritella viscosa]SGZ07744.1 FMN-dependent NADH-azoreductase-Azo-dye reductase-FMN-dependent NADH-azo compound oxidoreductase [Moritella viscosa]SHN99917.1 FMN-dependent NADH-azoreductase-Azo-dye reductase-FMN-dependent NADH-azo compound oxidoreductase [Moritella viscosa]
MKILHIDSSLQGNNSTSSKIATKLIEKLDVNNTQEQQVTYRDLNVSQVPHLTDAIFSAFHTPEAERTIEQQAAAAVSDQLIDEVSNSDILIIAVPMYNFGVPSTLKAWIDHIARAGKTFSYTAEGPKPLLEMPKTYVIATRGGIYANTPVDTQAPWLEQVLKFVGVQEVEFIFAEGLAMNSADDVLSNADARISELLSA